MAALLVPVVCSVPLLVDIFLKEGVWSWFWFRTEFLMLMVQTWSVVGELGVVPEGVGRIEKKNGRRTSFTNHHYHLQLLRV